MRYLGAGLEWADGLEQEIIDNLSHIKVFEMIPENFVFGKRPHVLKAIADSNVPVLIHSVELSVGTAEPVNLQHLDMILDVAAQVNTVEVSDHLCMVRADGMEVGQLTTLPFSPASADVVSRNIEAIQNRMKERRLEVGFAIENITNTFLWPDNELSETQFINSILSKTGCSFLLDLNNIYTNGYNYKFNPFEWLDRIQLDKLTSIHLAGGFVDADGSLQDGHNRPVPDPVFKLLDYTCQIAKPKAVLVERTGDFPSIDELLGEVKRAQGILDSHFSSQGLKLQAAAAESSVPEVVGSGVSA